METTGRGKRTLKKACAVISFVASFWRFQTPSRCVSASRCMRHLGLTRTSNLRMYNVSVRSRGASDGRVDGVEAVRSHEDAIDANFNFGKREKKTLSQRPPMLNSRFGLSFEYTETKEFSHSQVVKARGNRFWTSQKTARPKFTSCFINRIL